ncbi:hypothetical protein D3C71_776920 [compost metagenome]
MIAVTGAVGRDALVQGCGGVVEQLRRATLDLRRLRPLRAERRGGLRAVSGLHFERRLTGQIGNVVNLVAIGGSRIGAEAGDVSSQIPTLTIIQLIGEGRHVSALNPEAQSVVDRVETQVIQTCVIAQIGRWRRQADACRAVARTGVAMAHRTVLSVQRRATGRVRGNDRRLADLIGHGQFRAELPRLTCDVGAILTRGDRFAQRADALLQRGLFRFGRHCRHQSLQSLGELKLLAIFGLVDDLACLHRFRVVRTDVVE